MSDHGNSNKSQREHHLYEIRDLETKDTLTGIPGRKKAREIEDQYIDDYKAKHGQPPRGNRDRK